MDPTNKSVVSTPSSSPGLFSPAATSGRQALSQFSDGTPHSSPFLHPLQGHKVKETHKADVDFDEISGRKLINQYEIINEIGRGVHGKVKLARSLETGDYVAIKIIQRFSKKRKLGRVTVSPEDKTKREIAILKKIRHPNVVGLLEVIDDPELKKIYMVLEHVELGEIIWRKKGNNQICIYERRRIEREQRGEKETAEDEKYWKLLEIRRQRKESQKAKLTQLQLETLGHHWSLEHGDDEADNEDWLSRYGTQGSSLNLSHSSSHKSTLRSHPGSRAVSRAPSAAASRTTSRANSRTCTPPLPLPLPTEPGIPAINSDNEEDEPGQILALHSNHGSSSALDGSYYGAYPDEPLYRGRSPSMADSIISHMSSIDGIQHDAFEDDFSYVPCFTLDQARRAFRDTVLGLEYLHYEGIVHRDIKPANLLWTKDHRVKISDFGVSYFGRPIREGETEENISEADATDFDDDLELAKTVGTPAFFAPELCYTDLDVEQPKVTEQIDVWSLGITLYCLIYARIPFLADDEYQLFRCIAKEDVYIPRQRLKPVDPNATTVQQNPIKRVGHTPYTYREESQLEYEDIDDDLYDLLKQMLKKDPLERIKLRDVKRHPWVVKDIDNVIGWVDDTDPSRKTSGRRIEVNRNELERAVVPITFLERARSAVKKTINKVIGATRSETRGDGSRRRATSNTTSSGNETPYSSPITPGLREGRRASLRGDESIFAALSNLPHHRETTEHPLAQSVTASPDLTSHIGDLFGPDFAQQTVSVGPPKRVPSGTSDPDSRPGLPDRTDSSTGSIQTVLYRGHSHSRSVNAPIISTMDSHPRTVNISAMLDSHSRTVNTPTSAICEGRPTTPGPFTDHMGGIFYTHLWQRGRDDMTDIEEGVASRARSVDRKLFESENKHAEPSVAMSNATAGGHFQHALNSPVTLKSPRPLSRNSIRSLDASSRSRLHEKALPSPQLFQPMMVHAYQQSASSPDVRTNLAASILEDRPSTANRTPEEQPLPRGYNSPPGLQRAREEQEQKREIDELKRQLEARPSTPSRSPPSPGHESAVQKQDTPRVESYSTMASQATSPSQAPSPISSMTNLGSQEQLSAGCSVVGNASVPSLPALTSSTSSLSADTEGETLPCEEGHSDTRFSPWSTTDTHRTVRPSSSIRSSTLDTITPQNLTPPLLSKKSSDEGETLPGPPSYNIALPSDDEGYKGEVEPTFAHVDEDSDSDEGLTMTRRKPKHKSPMRSPVRLARFDRERRDTNASVGSTETAKKIVLDR